MRKFFTLFILSAFLLIPNVGKAADYTVEPGTIAASYALPIFMGNTTSSSGSFYGSITQHIYLASELLDANENLATEGDITDITFYYTSKTSTTASSVSRTVGIYLMEVESSFTEYTMTAFPYQDIYDNTQYCYQSYFLYNASNKAGANVYSGALTTEEVTSPTVKSVKLHLTTPFHWSGNKNIVMTVWDKTASTNSASNLRFQIASTKTGTAPSEVGHPRFAYTYWTSNSAAQASWITDNGNYDFSGKLGDFYGSNTTANKGEDSQKKQRSYVPKVTFSISTTIPAPTGLAASSITTSAAHLAWNAVDGATGYNVKWGTNSGSLDHSAEGVSNTYLDIDELVDGTTYYFAVQTITAGGTSSYSEEEDFETEAIVISHDGIDFIKWNSTDAMPLEGDYYLSADVDLVGIATVSDDLNLDLYGHKILTSSYGIVIPEGKSLSLYDYVGEGVIRGGYAGTFTDKGLVSNHGTLVMKEGAVVNLANNANDYNVAIYNNGTFKLSGNPTISGVKADIYLGTSKTITIEEAKPLTNSTLYSVDAVGTTITSGWANMNGANPNDYFASAKSGYDGICVVGNEANLAKLLTLDEAQDNDAISDGTYSGAICVSMTRSLTSSQYNTFCLPFALNNAQLEEAFGAGYDLEEFVEASIDGDVLSLTFNKVTSLEAGKPYLLQPSIDVVNPSFEGVTISATSPVDQTSDTYISFHGTYAPTELTGGNRNLLFLGAGNELFWPAEGGNNTIKGFRAYFEVKPSAGAAKRARIVKKEEGATGMDQITNDKLPMTNKILRNGQLLILRDNKTYNVLGMEYK